MKLKRFITGFLVSLLAFAPAFATQKEELIAAIEAGDTTTIKELLKELLPKMGLRQKIYGYSVASYIRTFGDPEMRLFLEDLEENTPRTVAMKPLKEALESGNTEEAIRLLSIPGTDLEQVDRLGNTALHLALESGNKRVVDFLIENKANVNARDQHYETPLHLAASRLGIDFVQTLIGNNADMEATSHNGTPLHGAARAGKKHVAQYLVSLGANLEAKDQVKATPLHYAAHGESFDHAETVHFLIASKADIHATTKFGKTPLHSAASYAQTADLLLENSADAHKTDCRGNTPLHILAKSRLGSDGLKAAVARMMLAQKANINTENSSGKTPLWLARENRSFYKFLKDEPERLAQQAHLEAERIAELERLEREKIHKAVTNNDIIEVKRLIDAQADVNAEDSKGSPPLYYADNSEIAERLIESNANPNWADCNTGFSTLHSAAKKGNIKLAQVLLANKANLDTWSNEGKPLHSAVKSQAANKVDMVRFLLENKANPHEGERGLSLLSYVCNHFGHDSELAQLLRDPSKAVVQPKMSLDAHFAQKIDFLDFKTDHGIVQVFFGPDLKDDIDETLQIPRIKKYIELAANANINVTKINCDYRAEAFGRQLLLNRSPDEVKKIVIYETNEHISERLLPSSWLSGANDVDAHFHAIGYVKIIPENPSDLPLYLAFDHGVRLKEERRAQIYVGTSKEALQTILEQRYLATALGLLDIGQNYDEAKSEKFPFTTGDMQKQ